MAASSSFISVGERKRLELDNSHEKTGRSRFTCVELFTGCGGLATGLEMAGAQHVCMAEWNAIACETLRRNVLTSDAGGITSILEQDVREADWRVYRGVDLVAGGPPCQPFSRGGLAAGARDPRNMWPEAIRAVKDIRPRAFAFENVKGLLRPAFFDYLAQIVKALKWAGADDSVGPQVYDVAVISINAADYGVPQKRERVFVAGVRMDCGVLAPFSAPTHSLERLVWEKWVSGDYWQRHNLPQPKDGPQSRTERLALRKLMHTAIEPRERAWRTCRDAFTCLGLPTTNPDPSRHEFRAGARIYPGHEGSPVDEPAKALKAGSHGVPGGENMLVDSSGFVRYFTVREAARLQGMPDSFVPAGTWSQAMSQLGNAVPAQLGEVVGRWIMECAER